MVNLTNNKKHLKKVLCLNCGSVFNSDYKLKHEKIFHNGKKITTKHYGAPKSQFEAAKRICQVCTY